MIPYIRHKTLGKFRLGDIVKVIHGGGGEIGEVIEDYGQLGPNRIYTVKVRTEDNPEFAFREIDLELVDRPAKNGKRHG